MAFRNWTPVTSSRLQAIDYDPATQTLYIKFLPNKGGESSVYAYSNVTPEQARELNAAKSKGKWFSQIKNAPTKYPYKKIGVETEAEDRLA